MEQALLATVREILAGPSVGTGVIDLDELTGVYAASFGVRRLAEEVERALRYQHPLSCFILEPDGLEAVNQQHGPARGDRVLQDVGAILRHAARAADVACRLDGSRFLVITPRLDLMGARAQAEKFRERVARHRFPVPGCPALSLTASCGVASVSEDTASAESLLDQALEALAEARTAGGNPPARR
jgi:two-component system cell cycle response regulator